MKNNLRACEIPQSVSKTPNNFSLFSVAIFWVVNASSGEKVVYSFRYRPGPGQVGREVFHIVLSHLFHFFQSDKCVFLFHFIIGSVIRVFCLFLLTEFFSISSC